MNKNEFKILHRFNLWNFFNTVTLNTQDLI